MDESLFTLDMPLFENVTDMVTTRESFFEFCMNIDKLEQCLMEADEWYLTEGIDSPGTFGDKVKKSAEKTVKTTKDIVGVYDTATKGVAAVMQGSWNSSLNAIHLGAKVLEWVLEKVAIILQAIGNLLGAVKNLPAYIKNKIKGNLELYIPIDDLKTVYGPRGIMTQINGIMGYMEEFIKTDTWENVVKRKHIAIIPKPHSAICEKLTLEIGKLGLVKFDKSVVEMTPPAVEAYFGTTNRIHFVDTAGTHDLTYLEMLDYIAKDINKRQATMKKYCDDVSVKQQNSQYNDAWKDLSTGDQNRLNKAFTAMGKAINIVSNIVKYVLTDISTVNSAIKSITKKQEKAAKKEQKEAEKLQKKAAVT